MEVRSNRSNDCGDFLVKRQSPPGGIPTSRLPTPDTVCFSSAGIDVHVNRIVLPPYSPLPCHSGR